jgi:hypothetical protein
MPWKECHVMDERRDILSCDSARPLVHDHFVSIRPQEPSRFVLEDRRRHATIHTLSDVHSAIDV